MNERKLIFCKECSYFEKSSWGGNDETCLNPANIKETVHYDEIHYEWDKDPWERNQKNDCVLFKEKFRFWKWIRNK